MFHQRSVLSTAVSAALLLGTAQAGAQILEEVIVTATKRVESLQDVPISMLAMGGDAIQKQGFTNMADVTVNMPSVTVVNSPIGNQLFIRGVGTPGSNQGIEQSVSTFHDGIWMGRHQLSRSPFMDLARVELLRGPQSILFGKNTIGGALSVVSAAPTEELEASIRGLYGEDGEVEYNGMLSGPLTENISGRLALRGYQLDGYLDNTVTGDDNPERDDKTVRTRLRWDGGGNLVADFKAEYSKFKTKKGTTTQLSIINPLTEAAASTSALNALLAGGPEKFDDKRAVINDGGAGLRDKVSPIRFGGPGFPDKEEESDNKMTVVSLNLDWQWGEHTITSLTGYAHYEYTDVCDCDFAALPLIQVDAEEDYDQYSQELRIASPLGNTFEYIAGVYYQSTDLDYDSDETFGTNLLSESFGNVARTYGLDQESDMFSGFGQLTWNFADDMRATAGLRYTSEEKEADHPLDKRFSGGWTYPFGTFGDTPEEYDRFEREAPPALVAAYDMALWAGALGTFEHDIRGRNRDEDNVSWSLNLEYDLNEDVLLYGTIGTGFKGGGFDARFLKPTDNPNFEYEDEEANSVEIGSKMTLLDGSMTLNVAGFYTTIDDYQVSVFDGATAFLVTNAAEVETYGVETDMRWAATDNLTIGAAVSYLKATYDDFKNNACTVDQVVAAREEEGRPNRCENPLDPLSAGTDVSGETQIYSPEWSGNLNAEYRMAVFGSMELSTFVNLNYSDDFVTASDLDKNTSQDSFTKIDARIALGSADGVWEVAVIGRNLTDEDTISQGNDQPLVQGNFYAQTERLRSYAVQATWNF